MTRNEPNISVRLRELKSRTSWSWERLCLEFQRVMGSTGPSFSTIFRYATKKQKRRNPLLDLYVREAVGRIEAELGMPGKVAVATGEKPQSAAGPQTTELRLRQLLDRARDVVYRYRILPTPGYDYVSAGLEDVTGYTPEEFYADPDILFKMVHPEDHWRLKESIAGKNLTSEPSVVRWVRKDGQVVWVERLNVPILDERGNLVAIEGIARNVTNQRKIEEQAKLLSAIVESAGDAVISSDSSGQITSWNRAAERLFGYTAEEMMGKSASVLHPPDDPGLFYEIFAKILSGEAIDYPDVERVHKNGRKIRVSVRLSPIKDEQGELTGFAGFLRALGSEKSIGEFESAGVAATV